MISVAPLAGGGSAEYYLDREAGCEADYYLDRDEAAGRWLGGGAAALELAGALDEGGAAAFRALLAGRHPSSGAVLARPVWRAYPAGRLPGAPLVEAVHRVAAERGTSVSFVLGDDRLSLTFAGIASAVERRPGMRSLDPRVAARVASAAGLEPVEVFRSSDGADVFSPALEHAGDRYDDRNAAYDVCVSAPKSVSTLYALASPETAAAVSHAHSTAVRTALAYLEREVGHGLRGHQGDGQRAARIGTDGFIAAAFAHRTSRENEPQLHTHVVVANLLHGDDGKWSAVDSRSLHRHATTASYLYQATLRGELTRELGVAWTPVNKGIAEIAGIPTDLTRAFSTRRAAIDNYLSVTGRDDPAAAQHACLATRPKKTRQTATDLREQWTTTARNLGHDPAKVLAAALGAGSPATVDLVALIAELTGPTGLTRRKTTVDRRDVLQALCEALPAGTTVSLGYVDQLCEHLTRHRAVVETRHRADSDGPQFSTAELIATEQHALATADTLRQSSNGYYSALMPHINTLSDDQRKLVTQLVYGDQQLSVVVGPAGSGKTAALSVAHRAWRSADIPVIGSAVAALAARGLQTATGIPSVTMTRLLADLDTIDPRTRRRTGFAYGTVVVVDEASMVDTRTLARLLDHTQQSGARLVLVGDSEQLPEIDAGGLFRTLADHPDTHRLTANVRQQHDWERDALQALRTNRPAQALMAYLDRGRVRVDVPDALFTRLTSDYMETSECAPLRTVALAATRREVAALNAAIQLAHRDRDRDADGVYVDIAGEPRAFHVGDVLVVTRNHREHGVLNGLRGQVTAIDRNVGSLVMTDTDGSHYELPHSLLASGDVDHGYALTVHRAQGITVDTALVFGTAALTKEAGYVALSRGRVANYLYTSPQELKAAARVDPFDDSASRLRRAIDDMTHRLLVSRRHQLASSYLPAAASSQRAPAHRPYEPSIREARGLSR